MLEAGQVWSLRNMPAGVRFSILRIEPWGEGRVIHGALSGCGEVDAGGIKMTIDGGHMPFAEAAVLASVLELAGEGAVAPPGFEDGYAEWREAGGGAFTLTIDEAVRALFGTVGE